MKRLLLAVVAALGGTAAAQLLGGRLPFEVGCLSTVESVPIGSAVSPEPLVVRPVAGGSIASPKPAVFNPATSTLSGIDLPKLGLPSGASQGGEPRNGPLTIMNPYFSRSTSSD